MAENLELKVTANTGEAVANLKKTEDAVDGVKNKTEQLGKAGGGVAASMKQASEGITKIRNAVMEWASALQIGVTIGNALVDVTNKIAAAIEKKAQALEKAAAKQQAYKIALDAVRKGHIEEGETLDKTVENYVAMTAAMGRLDEASRKYVEDAGLKIPETFKDAAEAGKKMETVIVGAFNRSIGEGHRWVEANRAAIGAYIAKMDDAQRRTSANFIAMVDSANRYAEVMKRLPAAVEVMLPAFKGTITTVKEAELAVLELAKAEGVSLSEVRQVIEKEYERTDAIGVTAEGYDKLIAAIDRLSDRQKKIPMDIDVEIRKRRELQDEIDKFTAGSKQREQERVDAVNKTYEQNHTERQEWIKEQARIEQGMREWTDATQGARSAFGALSGDFTAINAEVRGFIEAGGRAQDVMVGMTGVAMTWNRSTEEMNRTLERQLEIMGRLDEKMVQALDKYEQWRSAIATAVSALQDGTTSSSGFIEMMNQLATQLSTNFGAAAGEAGDEVRRLIATIQALIATATMGGSTSIDPTLWGGLEREYGKGKK